MNAQMQQPHPAQAVAQDTSSNLRRQRVLTRALQTILLIHQQIPANICIAIPLVLIALALSTLNALLVMQDTSSNLLQPHALTRALQTPLLIHQQIPAQVVTPLVLHALALSTLNALLVMQDTSSNLRRQRVLTRALQTILVFHQRIPAQVVTPLVLLALALSTLNAPLVMQDTFSNHRRQRVSTRALQTILVFHQQIPAQVVIPLVLLALELSTLNALRVMQDTSSNHRRQRVSTRALQTILLIHQRIPAQVVTPLVLHALALSTLNALLVMQDTSSSPLRLLALVLVPSIEYYSNTATNTCDSKHFNLVVI